jgi:hypothetical protein
MHSSVISRYFLIFLALFVFASCGRAGGKIEAHKAKSATKPAVTGTGRDDSAPKRTASNKTTSNKTASNKTTAKKTDTDYNGVTQFHEP